MWNKSNIEYHSIMFIAKYIIWGQNLYLRIYIAQKPSVLLFCLILSPKWKRKYTCEVIKANVSRHSFLKIQFISSYQYGPDTYLLQVRDAGFPARLREYLNVAKQHSADFQDVKVSQSFVLWLSTNETFKNNPWWYIISYLNINLMDKGNSLINTILVLKT